MIKELTFVIVLLLIFLILAIYNMGTKVYIKEEAIIITQGNVMEVL